MSKQKRLKNIEGYHVVYLTLLRQKLFYAKKRIGRRDQISSIAQSILKSCVQSLADSFFFLKQNNWMLCPICLR